jgi:hypothetical protein
MTTTKPPGSYLHGDVVVVPIRIAAIIAENAPLTRWRSEARGLEDAELYYVLSDLSAGAQQYDQQAGKPLPRPTREPEQQVVTVKQAAGILHMEERSVRALCQRRKLRAARVQDRWQIDLASVREYAN